MHRDTPPATELVHRPFHGCLTTGRYRGHLDPATPAYPFDVSLIYEERTCGVWLTLAVPPTH